MATAPDGNVVISGRRSLGDTATIESVKSSFRLRGAEVFHTAEDGYIRVEASRRELSISTLRPHVRAIQSNLMSANLLQSE